MKAVISGCLALSALVLAGNNAHANAIEIKLANTPNAQNVCDRTYKDGEIETANCVWGSYSGADFVKSVRLSDLNNYHQTSWQHGDAESGSKSAFSHFSGMFSFEGWTPFSSSILNESQTGSPLSASHGLIESKRFLYWNGEQRWGSEYLTISELSNATGFLETESGLEYRSFSYSRVLTFVLTSVLNADELVPLPTADLAAYLTSPRVRQIQYIENANSASYHCTTADIYTCDWSNRRERDYQMGSVVNAIQVTEHAVPEPAALSLLAFGALLVTSRRARQRIIFSRS